MAEDKGRHAKRHRPAHCHQRREIEHQHRPQGPDAKAVKQESQQNGRPDPDGGAEHAHGDQARHHFMRAEWRHENMAQIA